jgi:DNA replication protein DnaC
MKDVHIDEARLGIMLNELRLPTIKTLWSQFAEQADREGWPAARFLSAIAEHELAERDRRRIERHLKPICRPERRSTASPSTPYPWCRRRRSWP